MDIVRQFLPQWLTEVPAIADLATALDGVWRPEVSEPAALLLDVRNLSPDSERELLRRSAYMLGYTGRHQLFDNPRLHRLITHMPKFRSQNATELYKSFLAFLLNHPLEVDNCWTDDYVGFFATPLGPRLVDALGNRTSDNEGWYPTTHVIVRCRPKSIFPDSADPYNDMLELFYKIAPAYVVVEHVGAVADMFSNRLQLNLGVVEGYSERAIVQDIEIPSNVGDWQAIKPLPYRVQGHSADTINGKTYIAGGYTGQTSNENLVFSISMSGISWESVDAGARSGSDIVCSANSGTYIALGTTTGDILVSSDTTQWTKVWTPLVNMGEPIVALCYNAQSDSWLACGSSGTTVVSNNVFDWNVVSVATTPLRSAATGAGKYVLFPKNSTSLLYSLDGVNWSGTKISDTNSLVGGAYHSDLDQWIVVGECGLAWTSQNLIDWTPVNIGIDFEVSSVAFCRCLNAVIVYGNNAVFGYSYNLLQWFTPDTLFRTQDILAGTYIQWVDQFFLFSQNTFVRGKDTVWNRYKWPLRSNRKKVVSTANVRTVRPPAADLTQITDVEAIFQILFNEGYVNADGTGYEGANVRDAIRQALSLGVDVRTILKQITAPVWTEIDNSITSSTEIDPYPLGIISVPSLKKIVVYGREGFVNVATVQARTLKHPSMNERRAYHTSFVDNDYLYVVGGQSRGSGLSTCEKFDTNSETWTYVADIPVPLHNACSAVTQLSTDNWAIRYTGFGTNSIRSCAYDVSGRWLIGGTNGVLAESEHGIHWTQLEIPFPSKTVTSFTANRNTNIYHLYGYQTKTGLPQILSSTDTGKTWIPQDSTWFSSPINVARYFEKSALQILIGGIHAPTEEGLPNVPTVVGADGLNWTVDDVTSTLRLGTKSVYGGIYSYTYGKYVMCVDGGVVVSADKKNWRYSSFLNSRNEIENRIPCSSITELAGTFVALAADGRTYFSTDCGESWHRFYSGTIEAATLTSEMDWDQEEWVQLGFYRPRYSHLVTSSWNNRVWAHLPSGNIYFSSNNGFTWSIGGPVDPGTPPFARKLGISTELQLVARTRGETVEFSNGDGVTPTWVSVTITDGVTSEENATSVCYVGNQRWLVGGAKLWLVSNPTGIVGPVPTSIVEVPVRLRTGPELASSFVSGTLEQQIAQYQITCIDEQGESRPSNICVVSIPASTEGVGISLSWSKVSGVRGYRIYGRKQGSMYLLAELSANATNYVDDGSAALRLAQQMPISDTSGLMKLETKTIVDIVWSEKAGMVHIVTDQGYIARSTDLSSWYGVLNPSILAAQTRATALAQATDTPTALFLDGSLPQSTSSTLTLPAVGTTTLPTFLSSDDYVYPGGLANVWQIIMAEPEALYIIGGNDGKIGISEDGSSYSTTVQGTGTYVCAAFDKQRSIIALGATSGQVAYTQGKFAAITPSISNIVVSGGVVPTSMTVGYYQYMIASYRDGLEGSTSIANIPVSVPNSTSYVTLTIPVDNVDGYKIYRVIAPNPDMSGAGNIELLGILTTNRGQSSISFEDHGSTTAHSQRFIGSGLNDIIWDTVPDDVRIIQKFEVIVSSTGTPDRVRYRVNNGPWSSEYDAGPVTMENGIAFNFGATTGHTLRDRWSITVRPSPTVVVTLPFENQTAKSLTQEWMLSNAGKPLLDMTIYFSDKPLFVGVGPSGVTYCHELDTWESAQNQLSNLRSVASGVVGTTNTLVFGSEREVHVTSSLLTVAQRIEVPIDGYLNSIVFDPVSKQFVGVSVDSQIVTSVTGTNWVRRNVNVPKGDLQFVTTGINNQSLVTGGTIGTVFSSFDGKAWAPVDADITNGTVYCIIADDQNTGTLLLAGDGGTVMHSTDNGVSWTQVTPGYATEDQDTFGGIQTGDTNIVLYGHSLVVSTDTGATFAPPTEYPEFVGTPFVGIAVNRSTGTCIAITTGSRTYLSYDMGQDWSSTATFPELVQATCIAYGNNVWFVAGYDGRVAYSLDDGGHWTSFDIAGTPYLERQYESTSRQRIDFVGCCYEDNAFIVVGSQGDCFRVDTTTWIPVAMNTRFYGNLARHLFSGNNTVMCYGDKGVLSTRFFGYDKSCLVIGGLNNNNPVSTTYRYDPDADSWTTVAPLPAQRYSASAVACRDNSILVIGGCDSNGIPMNSVIRYLPHLDIWTDGPSLPYYKGWSTAHKIENCRIIVNGGGIEPLHRSIVLSELEAPVSKKWLTRGTGNLGAGTYGYRVSAIVGGTETLPTEVQTITVTAESGVLVDWNPVPGATEYRIYGRDINATNVLAQVYPPISQYLDTGSNVNLIGQPRVVMGEPVWQDIREQMPLPREYFASSVTPYGLLVCGGGTDDRCWVLNLNERNIVRSAWDNRQDLIYVEDDYVEIGYVE